ncbi:MAG TPA: hypothetical protein VEH56_01945 [Candidatus Saccharimonadales bacterium]|nr:hypothetical protein [Candidatus Saccharimonadales bacterium]
MRYQDSKGIAVDGRNKDIATRINTSDRVVAVGPGSRMALINLAGLSALVAFTALVYLRTQEPLILLIGGLISVVSVIGTTMGKNS